MNINNYIIIFTNNDLVLTKRKFPNEKYPNDWYMDEEYPWYSTMWFPSGIKTVYDFIEFMKDEWIRNMTDEDKIKLKNEMEKYDKLWKDFIIKIEDWKYLWVEEYDREKIIRELKKKWIKFGLEKWKEIQEKLKKKEEEWLLDKVRKLFR